MPARCAEPTRRAPMSGRRRARCRIIRNTLARPASRHRIAHATLFARVAHPGVAAPADAAPRREHRPRLCHDGGFLSAPAVPTPPRRADRVEPEVTIIETDEEVIYEYRVKGRVYMVKIQPIVGPPYYLLDTNGDGTLDVQESHEPNIALPQWLLFSW